MTRGKKTEKKKKKKEMHMKEHDICYITLHVLSATCVSRA